MRQSRDLVRRSNRLTIVLPFVRAVRCGADDSAQSGAEPPDAQAHPEDDDCGDEPPDMIPDERRCVGADDGPEQDTVDLQDADGIRPEFRGKRKMA